MAGILSFIFVFALIALPISLIKPNIFAKFFAATRVKNAMILGIIILVSFIGIAITAPEPTKNSSEVKEIAEPAVNSQEIKANPTQSQIEALTPAPTETPTPTLTPTKAPTAVPIKFAPILTPTPMSIVPIESTESTDSFACNCSKTCKQISSCAEAQYLLNSCGCGARDGDDDGIACDSAPLNCQN